jgi:NAD(P)H-dependent flavin oxidoreductase YrpB (nitropropane dioxygenase family)
MPFWLAGSCGTLGGLLEAQAHGAVGIQVETAFAFCEEWGLTDELKAKIIGQVADGTVEVRSDWRASPTGFPFRVVQVEGSISEDDVFQNRRRVCDLGALRVPYKTDNGSIGYRCPAEPLKAYDDVKGGRLENTDGRACLCNGLLATAGLPQYRVAPGAEEPPIVTAGSDFGGVRAILERTGTAMLPTQPEMSSTISWEGVLPLCLPRAWESVQVQAAGGNPQ